MKNEANLLASNGQYGQAQSLINDFLSNKKIIENLKNNKELEFFILDLKKSQELCASAQAYQRLGSKFMSNRYEIYANQQSCPIFINGKDSIGLYQNQVQIAFQKEFKKVFQGYK